MSFLEQHRLRRRAGAPIRRSVGDVRGPPRSACATTARASGHRRDARRRGGTLDRDRSGREPRTSTTRSSVERMLSARVPGQRPVFPTGALRSCRASSGDASRRDRDHRAPASSTIRAATRTTVEATGRIGLPGGRGAARVPENRVGIELTRPSVDLLATSAWSCAGGALPDGPATRSATTRARSRPGVRRGARSPRPAPHRDRRSMVRSRATAPRRGDRALRAWPAPSHRT